MATLKNSISVRLEGDQRVNLDYLSARNHKTKPTKLIRIGIDILAYVAGLNGGLIPLIEQIRLERDLIRRAARDRRRDK